MCEPYKTGVVCPHTMQEEWTVEPCENAMKMMEQRDHYIKALKTIAECKDKCLLGPESVHHRGPMGEDQHMVGSNAAFNQCAQIAEEALGSLPDSTQPSNEEGE